MHIGGACDESVNILNEIEIEKLYFVFWDTGKSLIQKVIYTGSQEGKKRNKLYYREQYNNIDIIVIIKTSSLEDSDDSFMNPNS